MIKEKPDIYLDEMVIEMKRRTNKEVSVSTIWRYLKYCGITHKKVKRFIIINLIINLQ